MADYSGIAGLLSGQPPGQGVAPRGPLSLLEKARAQFPYLRDDNLAYTQAPPNSGLNGYLEFWPPGETGAPDTPRPHELPIDRPGIQNISPKTRPIDVLGDYVSHYAVNKDPKLADLYNQFKASVAPETLQKRYEHDRQYEGETRPFGEWANASGYPGMFRGYTFDQWPADFSKQFYTPPQMKILDFVRSYLGINNEK